MVSYQRVLNTCFCAGTGLPAVGNKNHSRQADIKIKTMNPPEGPWEWIRGQQTTRAGVMVYAHGGGFAAGDPEITRAVTGELSAATGWSVLAVDYRPAPRHPYPAALHDVLDAYRAVLAAGGSPDRTVLAGDSAGGTLVLSAVLTLLAAGERPPAGLVTISPVTDLTFPGASFETNDGKDILNRDGVEQMRQVYLCGADPAAAPQSPAHGDLRGLPPMLTAVGSEEVLRDDVLAFAKAAEEAGVEVTVQLFDGEMHGFYMPGTPTAEVLWKLIGEWSRRLITR
jgi:acetyl esterase/lipase